MIYATKSAPNFVEPSKEHCLALVKANDLGELVGYKPERDSNGTVISFMLIGTDGLLFIYPTGDPYRVSSIYGWES